MAMRSSCMNCGFSKSPEYYNLPYCSDCTKTIEEARVYARENNLNENDVQRAALAERAHTTFGHLADPRLPGGLGG